MKADKDEKSKDSRQFHLMLMPSAVLLALLLAGCGAQGVRDDAQQLLVAGQYEQALQKYSEGLARYPESVPLRAGLVSAENGVISRLLTQANGARASGDDKAAEAAVKRALQIRPGDSRGRALLLEIERDRRLQQTVATARDLINKGFTERASVVIENGLKDDPHHAELLALQRGLEMEAKQAELQSARLSESRPISLDFRDANLRMVLEVVTRNSGINFVIDKDVRPELRTTIFMRQSRLDDALELLTASNQLAYKVIDAGTVLIYPRTPEKIKEYQDLVVRAFYLSNADVKQTAQLLKSMLKVRDPFVDEKLNMVMIRESPQTVRLAERVIALHDLAEPEVVMELEVLEVKRSSLTELGIKFPDAFSLTPLPPAGETNFTLGNIGRLNRDSIKVGLPPAMLNLHRDVGDVHILANPQVRARNREKAKILIGDKLPIVTTTGNAGNGGFLSESVQYVDVGLKLDVEPTVYLDDEVALRVGLEVSSMVRDIKTSTGSLVYQIGTRTASTVLRLRDGETQLLAGLINNEERMSANRVPGVGDLPLVGRLFSSQRDDGQRTEIVLSVTPHIVRNIRRPDLHQTEFWSGTENEARSRPLTLTSQRKPANTPGNGEGAIQAGEPGATSALAAASTPTGQSTVAGTVAQDAQTAPAAASLQLLAPAEVTAGEILDVQVELQSPTPLRGMPLQLEFSPQQLQILDAEEGAFFRQDGAATSSSKTLEQAAGLATLAVLRNKADGINGKGKIGSFRFKALKSGTAEIRLASVQVVGATMPAPALPPVARIKVK